jgi:hypothetical protein
MLFLSMEMVLLQEAQKSESKEHTWLIDTRMILEPPLIRWRRPTMANLMNGAI